LSHIDLDSWQAFVEERVDSTALHHRQWIELLMEQYGFKLHLPAITENGQVRAAMPFLETTSLRGSKKLVSLPFTDYFSVLSSGDGAVEILCDALRSDLIPKIKSVVFRSDASIRGLEVQSEQVRHELFTGRPLGQIEASFDDAVKRNLRRTRENDLQFKSRRDADAMETFYRLHLMTRKKLGVPVQPKRFFQRLHERMIQSELAFVGVVSKDREPIAAGVFLTYHKRFIYKYAASHPKALKYRPNDCLVYNGIKLAVEDGFDWFDFGASDKRQAGLRRFKRKWGASESDIYHNYIKGAAESEASDSHAFRIASAIIRVSPQIVCRALGEVFYKYSQ